MQQHSHCDVLVVLLDLWQCFCRHGGVVNHPFTFVTIVIGTPILLLVIFVPYMDTILFETICFWGLVLPSPLIFSASSLFLEGAMVLFYLSFPVAFDMMFIQWFFFRKSISTLMVIIFSWPSDSCPHAFSSSNRQAS